MAKPKSETPFTHWARRGPFGYMGAQLDRGELLVLNRSAGNNTKLIDMGFLVPIEDGDEPVQCGECGKYFLTDTMRTEHGNWRHRSKPMTEDEEMTAMEKATKRLEVVAPVFNDESVAAL